MDVNNSGTTGQPAAGQPNKWIELLLDYSEPEKNILVSEKIVQRALGKTNIKPMVPALMGVLLSYLRGAEKYRINCAYALNVFTGNGGTITEHLPALAETAMQTKSEAVMIHLSKAALQSINNLKIIKDEDGEPLSRFFYSVLDRLIDSGFTNDPGNVVRKNLISVLALIGKINERQNGLINGCIRIFVGRSLALFGNREASKEAKNNVAKVLAYFIRHKLMSEDILSSLRVYLGTHRGVPAPVTMAVATRFGGKTATPTGPKDGELVTLSDIELLNPKDRVVEKEKVGDTSDFWNVTDILKSLNPDGSVRGTAQYKKGGKSGKDPRTTVDLFKEVTKIREIKEIREIEVDMADIKKGTKNGTEKGTKGNMARNKTPFKPGRVKVPAR